MAKKTTRVEIGVIGSPPTPEQLRVPDVPETVVLNFSKACNLWCNHCYYPDYTLEREKKYGEDHATWPSQFLPPKTMEMVADEMSGWQARSVMRIAADGEPLLHPHAVEMVAYAKGKGVTVALTTNGIALTEKYSTRLLETGIDVIDVSIDAATPETYGKVRGGRRGANFYFSLERNVRGLIGMRDAAAPRYRTQIMVNMIDQPLAHDEVDEFIRKWKELGADAVLVRPFHTTSNNTLQLGAATTVEGIKRFPCKFPFSRLQVGFDGKGAPLVTYCSHDWWASKTLVGVLGRDGTLRDIWHGSQMYEIRRRHLMNDYGPNSFCGPCPDWCVGWGGKTHHGIVSELQRNTHG